MFFRCRLSSVADLHKRADGCSERVIASSEAFGLSNRKSSQRKGGRIALCWEVFLGVVRQDYIRSMIRSTMSAKSRVGNLGGTPRSSRIETLVRRHHPAPSIDVRAANDCSGLLATAFQFIPNS